jgi:hypothetical protein
MYTSPLYINPLVLEYGRVLVYSDGELQNNW